MKSISYFVLFFLYCTNDSCVLLSLLAGSADNISLTNEVAISCLKLSISYFNGHTDYIKKISAMIFPLLLVLPQVLFYFHLTSDLLSFCWHGVTQSYSILILLCLVDYHISHFFLHSQTQNLNFKALGLVNEINWPLFRNLAVVPSGESVYIYLGIWFLYFPITFFYMKCTPLGRKASVCLRLW